MRKGGCCDAAPALSARSQERDNPILRLISKVGRYFSVITLLPSRLPHDMRARPRMKRLSRPKISDSFNVPSGDSAVQAESRADDFIRAAGSSLAEKPTIFPPGRCRPDEIITELHLPTWLSGRVADRILRYAAIARENVVAGTDYGLGGRVYADLMQDVVLSETEKAHRPVPSIRRHKRATTRLTAPAYWKFESIPLQERDAMGQATTKWHHRRCL
jgi:hypothetical protein